MAKITKIKTGKVSFEQMKSLVNKRAGSTVAYSLKEDNPTAVKDWIPTGSRWLDSITGCDLDRLLYTQAQSVEFVLETIEDLLSTGNQLLFIWDSLALTPSVSDIAGDFNPNAEVGKKARILSKGMSKLVVPIANADATLLVLNQLKTNIREGRKRVPHRLRGKGKD